MYISTNLVELVAYVGSYYVVYECNYGLREIRMYVFASCNYRQGKVSRNSLWSIPTFHCKINLNFRPHYLLFPKVIIYVFITTQSCYFFSFINGMASFRRKHDYVFNKENRH